METQDQSRRDEFKEKGLVHSRSPKVFFFVSISFLILGSLVVNQEAPRLYPLKIETPWEWFIYPVEQNVLQRLPQITVNLKDVTIIPKTDHVWVVGDAGLILHSQDEGRTWQKPKNVNFSDYSNNTKLNLRVAQIQELAKKNGVTNQIPEIKRLFLDSDSDVRRIAYSVLEEMDNHDIRIVGDVMLTDPDWKVRIVVVEALGQLDVKELIPNIASLLKDQDPDVRIAALKALVRLGDKSRIIEILSLVENVDQRVSTEALIALGQLVAELTPTDVVALVSRVSSLLKNENPDVRIAALEALAHLYSKDKDRQIVYWIASSLKDTIGWVRIAALENLARLGAMEFTPKIGEMLQDYDPQVRIAALQALGQLNAKDQIPFLQEMIKLEKSSEVHQVIAQTIQTLSDKNKTSIDSVSNEQIIKKAATPFGSEPLKEGPSLRSVFFSDKKKGWIVGASGTILHSTDGGDNWFAQVSNTLEKLSGVYFLNDGLMGLAVGEHGVILKTTDGGLNWHPNKINIPGGLRDVNIMPDGKHGVIVADSGVILVTTDGGEQWNPQTTGLQINLIAIKMQSDNLNGWIAGDRGTILNTTNGGKTWNPQVSGAQVGLRGLQILPDGARGWISGENGTILTTLDGGVNWNPQISGTSVNIQDVAFLPDGFRGWAVGDGGVILATGDGGTSWSSQVRSVLANNQKENSSSEMHWGWRLENYLINLIGLNAIKPATVIEYRCYPAPWYWLVCVFSIGLAFIGIHNSTSSILDASIADMLASDRPLLTQEKDVLGYFSIAAGVSRFLRNRFTEPPLTMAVTGEWGSGKSSLMNFICLDLQKANFSTVWFNAWHHQKGEQILASLFANIRAQAIPSIFSRYGLLFRLNLLRRRGARHWLLLTLLIVLFSGSLTYIWMDYDHLSSLLLQINSDSSSIGETLWKVVLVSLPLSALIPPIFAAYSASKGFGLDPVKLIASSRSGTDKGVPLDPGARFKFAREFEDVITSLKPGRLVIFIDDLDRCSKENVLEVLETINFLISSGNCYIILGTALDWVETSVALGFKELNEELGNSNDAEAHRNYRLAFARKYLQKLINIEIPLPHLEFGDSLRLLSSHKSREVELSAIVNFTNALEDCFRNYRNGISVLILVSLGLTSGYGLSPLIRNHIDAVAVLLVTPKSEESLTTEIPLNSLFNMSIGQTGKGNKQIGLESLSFAPLTQINSIGDNEIVLRAKADALEKGIVMGKIGEQDAMAELVLRRKKTSDEINNNGYMNAVKKDDKKTTNPSLSENLPDFTPGSENTSTLSKWAPLPSGLILASLVVWLLLRVPVKMTRDSDDFMHALSVWHPWIATTCSTPRTVKRYLNWVRYLAMRYRSSDDESHGWTINFLTKFIGFRPSQTKIVKSDEFDERILVALSAIYQYKKEWVIDDEKFALLAAGKLEALFEQEILEQENVQLGSDEPVEQQLPIVLEIKRLMTSYSTIGEQNWAKAKAFRKSFLNAIGNVIAK
jgi:photosystem II stability/assembly factor-like uncharacterized protein